MRVSHGLRVMRYTTGLALLTMIIGLLGSNAWAQEARSNSAPPFRASDTWYVSGIFHGASISSDDFDGTSFVSGGGSSEIMPSTDFGTGAGFALGFRSSDSSFEFNYTSAEHGGEFAGVPVDSESVTYNFDYRLHYRTHARLQPHVLIGFGYGTLTVEDGSIGAGGEVKDAVFSGLGASLGGGANYHFNSHLSLGFDLGYRFQSYSSVDGVVDGDLGSNASGSGVFAALRATYAF